MSASRPLFLRPKASEDSSSDDIQSTPSTSNDKDTKNPSRKNHTKSRRGCQNCKQRRIKCPENHPSCLNCIKRSLKCVWPDIQIFQAGPEGIRTTSDALTTLQPSSPGKNFSMLDFRLFHHFIQVAYPHHPLDNDQIWTHDIPSISHNHDFLLHSMLALSASELLEGEPSPSLAYTAIRHRISAIRSLNESISKGCHTTEKGNAMLATCYALIHQSALLDDGICEFMTFTRGCVDVLWHMGANQLSLIFKNVLSGTQLQTMGPYLEGPPGLPSEITDEAVASLETFEHMCLTDGEKLMYRYILETAHGLAVSKRDAYVGLMHIYGCFCYEMSQSDFQIFILPTNEVGKLLQIHWVVVQSLLDPITIHEQGDRARTSRNAGSMRWMKVLLANIKPTMRTYYAWPIMQTHKRWAAERAMGCSISCGPATLEDKSNSETGAGDDSI